MAQFSPVGKLAFGSVTTVYQTVVTPAGPVRKVIMLNSLNQSMHVSFTGGQNDTFELESGESMVLDTEKEMFNSLIQAKAVSTLPTSGSLRITVIQDL